MIETDLYSNGGQYFIILGFAFVILAFAGAITWGTHGKKVRGRAIGIPILVVGILGLVFSIVGGVTTHDTEYSKVVQDLRHAGYPDPISITPNKTFTTGERWCALKPIDGDQPSFFKIVCEASK